MPGLRKCAVINQDFVRQLCFNTFRMALCECALIKDMKLAKLAIHPPDNKNEFLSRSPLNISGASKETKGQHSLKYLK